MGRPDLPARCRTALREQCGVPQHARIVIGVSGGLDSTVLLHLLAAADVEPYVLHVDYGLRGEESHGDAEFVRRLCAELGVGCKIVTLETDWSEADSQTSLQERARDKRYALLEQHASDLGAEFVAVAHHLDDQAETILLRLARGSGLLGLGGMRFTRPIATDSHISLVRPLLEESRRTLQEWADAQGIDFRQDRSNDDDRFDRVRVRKEVVPALVSVFGKSVVERIARTAEQTRAIFDGVVLDRIDDDLERILSEADDSMILDLDELNRMEPGWKRLLLLEICRRRVPDAPIRTSTVDRLEQLIESQPGRRANIGSATVWRERNRLLFEWMPRGRHANQVGIEPGRPLRISGSVILVEGPFDVDQVDQSRFGTGVPVRPASEVVDATVLRGGLTIGHWRAGERFQPLGMKGAKNISDFLTDQKVPPHRKSDVLVVRSGDRVVWVVGQRIAAPFRVTDETRQVIRMSCSEEP